MKSPKELNQDIFWLQTMKDLVTVYEEIAAARMNRIRSSVLTNRSFLQDLAATFQEVKASYRSEIEQLMKQKKIKELSKLSVLKRNGKTVAILLSANTGLYGDIIHKTFTEFADFIEKHDADVVIIGKMGEKRFRNVFPKRQAVSFQMNDTGLEPQDLQRLLRLILPYETMYVFHGKFETILRQDSAVANITSDAPPQHSVSQTPLQKYFFEPNLEQILLFFEEEILTSLLEQTFHESQLAKSAARMVTLDKAAEGVRGSLRKQRLAERLSRHQEQNKKQLNSLAGLRVWQVR